MGGISYSRPIGFRPWEISNLVNLEVVEQHAIDAAFLWTQRYNAVTSSKYKLRDLARADERVEANVDGLRVAAEAGWQAASTPLDLGPGEIFAAAVLAFESGLASRVQEILEVGVSDAELIRGLISGLGWVRPDIAATQAVNLISSKIPEVRLTGIAGFAIHRLDPGEALALAIHDEDARLAARSLRAAGELGRTDLLPIVHAHLGDTDLNCRFRAAWSSALLGDHSTHVWTTLRALAESESPMNQQASDIAFRILPIEEAHAWRLWLFQDVSKQRIAVLGAGSTGDPAAVPWLIEQMAIPKLARAAGAAFSMITGADLSFEDLDGEPPRGSGDADLEDLTDEDDEFRWPSPAAVLRWWRERKINYRSGVRYILGEPLNEPSLRRVLARGRQNQRAAAALELALSHTSEALFETRERGQRQEKKVIQWSS